jgi:hypothetical protein
MVNSSGPTYSNDCSTRSTEAKHHDPLDADHPHIKQFRTFETRAGQDEDEREVAAK